MNGADVDDLTGEGNCRLWWVDGGSSCREGGAIKQERRGHHTSDSNECNSLMEIVSEKYQIMQAKFFRMKEGLIVVCRSDSGCFNIFLSPKKHTEMRSKLLFATALISYLDLVSAFEIPLGLRIQELSPSVSRMQAELGSQLCHNSAIYTSDNSDSRFHTERWSTAAEGDVLIVVVPTCEKNVASAVRPSYGAWSEAVTNLDR